MSVPESDEEDQVDQVDEQQAKQNAELLQLAKEDDAANLRSQLLSSENASGRLCQYFNSKGESLLQAALDGSGELLKDCEVARLLLLEVKSPEGFSSYLTPDSCNYLSFELTREDCNDLIKRVFEELNNVDEFSDCLDACVRAAADCKDKEFLESCLKEACGDKWQMRIQSCDSLQRHSLHHAAISANLSSLAFLLEEFEEEVIWHEDKDGNTFLNLLKDMHVESLLTTKISDLVGVLSVSMIDPPLSPFKLDDESAKLAVRQGLPPLESSLLTASAGCARAKMELVKVIANSGNDRLLLGILSLKLLDPADIEVLDLPKLLRQGKTKLVKQLLLLRQSDIIEQAVLVHTECLEQQGSSNQVDGLEDLEQFSASICLNSIDDVYNACSKRLELQRLVHKHLMLPRNEEGDSFLETARNIPGIFSRPCFKDLVDRSWRQGIGYAVDKDDCCLVSMVSAITPRCRFFIHTAAFIIFFILLAVYVHVLVPNFQFMDIVMAAYCISFLLQEIHELLSSFKKYSTIWNAFDVAPIGIFGIGLLLKIVVIAFSSNQDSEIFYNCRVILAFSFLMFGFKFLSIMRAPESFGPFISMIKALFLRDLLPFLGTLYAALVVCSGVFFHALLYPGGRSYDSRGAIKSLNNTESYWNIYIIPLLLTFGEMQMDNHLSCLSGDADQTCPHLLGNKIYVRALIYIFLIIVNLLLFNLLIARFSLTVTMKDERSHHIWRRYRYELLQEFSAINVMPPPINLPSIMCQLLQHLYHCVSSSDTLAVQADQEDAGDGDGDEDCCIQRQEKQVKADGEDEEEKKYQLLHALTMHTNRMNLSVNRCDESSGLEKLQNKVNIMREDYLRL